LYLGKMYFNHNVRFLIYPIVLTDVKARIQPVNPTVFMIDPKFLMKFKIYLRSMELKVLNLEIFHLINLKFKHLERIKKFNQFLTHVLNQLKTHLQLKKILKIRSINSDESDEYINTRLVITEVKKDI